ncbi:uncharacterized protein SPPG_05652 [Spizellomyces punctatus DAOM BR117]|uniref:Uncharacterized protein n=1 Tax=Spizellomyces punctatus (strain DAOM BR117) TaxID=645134 RepID=A0A0L0HD35_SPIPD|nr:uncharacterized protein SPPG_05652 [Spizellomyces punctatus DAOM BR117]KNC99410.1 hypothetical protein SPPG_05652 [Spizellomyces punctatus DAOM BR117]|eukprot:XP_016607450.1 hypothetical protein SPPG_05652 [Spizellomyces punctatus DAOM BR117]
MAHVPYILISPSLTGSDFAKGLEQLPKNLYVRTMCETLPVDFIISQGFAGCWIGSFDEDWDTVIKDVCCRLKKHSRSVLIINKPSTPVWTQIQWKVAVECGINVLPVGSAVEGARFLARLAHQEHRPPKPSSLTSIKNKTKDPTYAQTLLQTVKTCPGVGDVKAGELLKRFETVERLVNAREEELVEVIGRAGAKRLLVFFGAGFAS